MSGAMLSWGKKKLSNGNEEMSSTEDLLLHGKHQLGKIHGYSCIYIFIYNYYTYNDTNNNINIIMDT